MKYLIVLILLPLLFFSIHCQNSESLTPHDEMGRINFGNNIDGIKIGDDSSTVINTLG